MSVDRSAGLLKRVFAKLDAILAMNAHGQYHPLSIPLSLAVAYSGGLDSSVLLHIANQYCEQRSISLFAFHVHHGISENADVWLSHCKNTCADIGVAFDSAYVNVLESGHHSIEARARVARYQALGELCNVHDVPVLLAAHHQDDQAETVMLQLLRGAGVAGLSGMDDCNFAPKLLGSEKLLFVRPLLELTRMELTLIATEQQISYVNDESNQDLRYARNALRLSVMPILEQIAPGYTERIARSAHHQQAANRLLTELAMQDLESTQLGDGSLSINQISAWSSDRINNLLRHWIGGVGAQMPTTARLDQIRTQLLSAKVDAMVTVGHGGWNIHRYRNRIYANKNAASHVDERSDCPFRWSGEASIAFPQFGGELHFDYASFGFDQAWLRSQSLLIHLRHGGERIKLASNRSTRDMKHHYQAQKIPFWIRQRLPFVSNDSKLLFAAGVGSDCYFCSEGEQRISLRWVDFP